MVTNVWPNASPPTSVTGVAECRNARQVVGAEDDRDEREQLEEDPDGRRGHHGPADFRLRAEDLLGEVDPAVVPVHREQRRGQRGDDQARADRRTPPVVPFGTTGWLRIDSGCCQWVNPATRERAHDDQLDGQADAGEPGVELDLQQAHEGDQDHPEARDEPGRDARVERVHVGADADGDAGRQEDGLPDVVDHGHESGGPAEHPGDDRVEAAGDAGTSSRARPCRTRRSGR